MARVLARFDPGGKPVWDDIEEEVVEKPKTKKKKKSIAKKIKDAIKMEPDGEPPDGEETRA